MSRQQISRRSFLKSSLAGAMGMTLLGMGGAVAEESKEQIQWAEAADVIVVGGGGAGFCAAIEAGRAGSSVLILEKAGFCGGDTLLSNGMMMAAGTELQKTIAGCDTDTAEAFAEQQIRYAQGQADEAMIREMCMESPKAIEFMLNLGRVYKHVDIIPPAWDYDTENSWGPRCHWTQTTHTEQSEGGHFQSLERCVKGMDNVKVYTETEVAHLITNDVKEVIGVVTVEGKYYRANKGVVLATASFGQNREMSKRYNKMQSWVLALKDKYQANTSEQTVSNTGDGIRMAQEIGADLALSSANVVTDALYIGGVGSGFYNEMYGVENTNQYYSTNIPGKIYINNRGMRFVQEDALWGYVNQEVYKEAMRTNWNADGEIKIWAIQDSAMLSKDVIGSTRRKPETNYGKLVQSADTLEELAERINVPFEKLKETVERWNEFSEKGEDADFGRRANFGKIEVGPFYAFPHIPNPLGALGGLRTDIDTHVLDVSGNPIKRLYAAGTIMSGMFTGPFYPSCGWAILGTVHWGRKAGQNIAKEAVWTTEEVIPMPAEEAPAPVAAAGNYNAGTYTATVSARNADMTVEVTFSETAITAINVTGHAETPGIGDAAIEKMTERILAAQSTAVDTLTGATVTSSALLTAVSQCIEQAKK